MHEFTRVHRGRVQLAEHQRLQYFIYIYEYLDMGLERRPSKIAGHVWGHQNSKSLRSSNRTLICRIPGGIYGTPPKTTTNIMEYEWNIHEIHVLLTMIK